LGLAAPGACCYGAEQWSLVSPHFTGTFYCNGVLQGPTQLR